jgi:hypothetical protein
VSAAASRRAPRLDWRFVVRGLDQSIVPFVFAFMLYARLRLALDNSASLFQDATLYYRATDAWVHGGNPWLAHSNVGTLYAAPPPALLLNLPLLPFGENVAFYFWPIAGLIGMALAIRHYHLPWWWLAFPPFIEGLLPGSPDLALVGLMVVGAGAVTAFVKPYAIPAMLAESRWRAILAAIAIGLATLLLLPWGQFLAEWPSITRSLAAQSMYPPLPLPIQFVVLVALLSLGRLGLDVATPALWPNAQPHYAVFSLRAAGSSRVIALAFALPGPVPISIAVIALAVVALVRGRRPSRRSAFIPEVPPGEDGEPTDLG